MQMCKPVFEEKGAICRRLCRQRFASIEGQINFRGKSATMGGRISRSHVPQASSDLIKQTTQFVRFCS